MCRGRSWIVLTGTFVLAGTISACVCLDGSVPFQYTPSFQTTRSAPLRVGMETLSDARPADDRKSTERIADVEQKITQKLSQEVRVSGLFDAVDYPANPQRDDLIIRGEIRRFGWHSTANPILFIPVVHLLMYVGVPVYHMEAAAVLHLQVIDPKTGQVAGEYDGSSTQTRNYTIDSIKVADRGNELALAFRESAKQIKEAMLADIRKGVIAAKP